MASLSPLTADMATAPSNSQFLEEFHPDYGRDVFMIVFSVEGKGFKVDAARLAQLSAIIDGMLYKSNGKIGLKKEGTVELPVIIQGCTAERFANFLGWLHHLAWAPLKVKSTQQLLDILHISHMWLIAPGVEFATSELLKAALHPVHRLRLAQQYSLQDWIEIPIRMLLAAPLERYTEPDQNNLDFGLYMLIATTKESIAKARKVLAHHPPLPPDVDNAPFCPQHATCKKVWVEKWFLVLGRRIHHPSEDFPLILIPEALKDMDHRGMNPECKEDILQWMNANLLYLINGEEDLIQQAVATYRSIFM